MASAKSPRVSKKKAEPSSEVSPGEGSAVADEETSALQSRVKLLEKRLQTAEAQCQAATKEIWQMEVEVGRMEERVADAEARAEGADEARKLKRELKAARAEIEALQAGGGSAELEELRTECARLQGLLEQAKASSALAEELGAECARLRGLLDGALSGSDAEELRAECARLNALLDQRQAELASSGSASELQAELDVMRGRLQEARAAELSAIESLADAREQLTALQGREMADPAEVEQLRAELQRAAEHLDDAEARLDRMEERARQAESDLQVQSSGSGRLVGALEVELESMRAAEAALVLDLQAARESAEQNWKLAESLREQLENGEWRKRLELSEDKAEGYQLKSSKLEETVGELAERLQASETQTLDLRRQLQSFEERAESVGRVQTEAETLLRDAEEKQRESWQRVRDAEMRANQAVVEAKKLADKLAEHERRAQESDKETQRLAFQDPLTGLPNINLLAQYLEFTVKQCVRYRRVAALLVVDIDRFKVFNEAMGFKAGDELLAKVAERLQQAIRETDSLGRRGEDEFLILLSELNVGDHPTPEGRLRAIHQHVEVVANRVMQMMAPPFTVQGQKFYLHVSIGLAICPDNGDTPQSLLENADTAMYHVKETGRNRHQFYTTDLRRRQEKRLSLDNQLRSALERGEFEVRYLPVVSLAKGKGTLVGVESLLRWNHRIDGVVGPDYFLPAAEESGMIIPIGQWVLQQTCAQMRDWLTQGLRIFASVNLSKRQLLQADLVESMARELTQNGIPPEVLYVEIAEGFNTFNPELMDQVINRLGASGIRIAIDDFGVGYSSLSRLNLNYTRVLKIDRSIVEGCPHDRQSSTVCIAAINLASSLGLLSLAEGVENVNQVKFLIKYGCALAQGFYFSEPVAPVEISNFHRSKKVWKI